MCQVSCGCLLQRNNLPLQPCSIHPEYPAREQTAQTPVPFGACSEDSSAVACHKQHCCFCCTDALSNGIDPDGGTCCKLPPSISPCDAMLEAFRLDSSRSDTGHLYGLQEQPDSDGIPELRMTVLTDLSELGIPETCDWQAVSSKGPTKAYWDTALPQ